MEASLYPKNLRELDLSFTETIYAIAFGLEDELHARDKAEVFADLDLTPEQMESNVKKTLDKMGDLGSYALHRVLGDLDAAQDAEKFGTAWALENRFECAYNDLRRGRSLNSWQQEEYRYLLMSGQPLWVTATATQLKPTPDNAALRERIEQLTVEVQFYAERCDRAMKQLQELAAAVEDRESITNDSALQEALEYSAVIDGIYWPYRSAEVLRELKLTRVEGIVKFFGDFRNFVDAENITLMEWSVITTILREKKLLHATGEMTTIETSIDDFEFSVRTRNCLKRAGITNVEDLMFYFSDGAESGWDRLRKVRNLGRKSLEEVIIRLRTLDLTLEDGWCYLTNNSPVGALDFDWNEWSTLRYYQIQTVEQLSVACQDRNRFTGLRYIDNKLYRTATIHLGRYGFC